MLSIVTPGQIFAANNVLTVELAISLFGKKIAITSSEYYMNKPTVAILTPTSIVSEWELSANELMEAHGTRQAYWQSYMNKKQIDEKKTRLRLVDAEGRTYCVAHTKYDNWYNEPTFTGSDADREVYYVIIDKIG